MKGYFKQDEGINYEGKQYREILFISFWKGDTEYTAGKFDLINNNGVITHLYGGESETYKTIEEWKNALKKYGYEF